MESGEGKEECTFLESVGRARPGVSTSAEGSTPAGFLWGLEHLSLLRDHFLAFASTQGL